MAEKMKSSWRGLVALLVIVAVGVGSLVIGKFASDAEFVPKLALDLEGGTQVILTPKAIEGEDARRVTADDMTQAINIIRQRVDASGVAEAEITTLGSDNIVVSIPGKPDPATLDLIRTSAVMRFRPVLQVGAPAAISAADLVQSGADSQSGEGAQSAPELTSEEIAMGLADPMGTGELADEPETEPADNSDLAWITPKVYHDFLLKDCTAESERVGGAADDPKKPVVACDVDGASKYILGPVDVEGTRLANATAGMGYNSAGQPTGQWVVNLELDAEGTKEFAEASKRLVSYQQEDPNRNRFAAVLDGNVITAPSMNVEINNGKAEISGNFTAESAATLAKQLSFGSLPLNFEVQSEQEISATLGANHLEKGIMAGVIGLILVVAWLIYQYRGLSLVATGSLLVAAVLTYLAITILSWSIGYRLSLPGVVGLIVAVGITADSFIVYFERVRDQVRDGVPLDQAVEKGWKKARRTVLISDGVNFVAAGVLYVLAVGGVQGFAFTLGLTTIVDVVVIFLFTHPMMNVLMRTRFFGEGHKWSGLDPEHLGAATGIAYVGRGRTTYRTPKGQPTDTESKTLAERKREAAAGASKSEGDAK